MIVPVMVCTDLKDLAEYVKRTGMVPDAIICGENAVGVKVYTQVPVECHGSGNTVDIRYEVVAILYERTVVPMHDNVVYVYQLVHVVRDPIRLRELQAEDN